MISQLSILMLFICKNGFTQSSTIVYTPKLKTPIICPAATTELDSLKIIQYRQEDYEDIIDDNLNAVIIGDPTESYNCHFYAWYLADSDDPTSKFIMRDSSIHLFLESAVLGDNSFKPCIIQTAQFADRMIMADTLPYASTAHSVAYKPDPAYPGKDWVAKCGNRSLIRHEAYQCPGYPYDSSVYRHYAKAYDIDWIEPYIEGLGDTFCEDSSTFKIIIDPHFYLSDVYAIDGKLDGDLENDSITLKRNSNSYGDCIIAIEIKNGAGESNTVYDTISLGSDLASVWGYWQDPVCMCAWNQYDIRTTYHPSDMSFDWQFMYGDVQDICPPYHIRVTPYIDGGYVTLVATNGCGVDTTINVNYPACGYCPSYYMVYPNPSKSSDIIYIETTKEALDMVARAKYIMEDLSSVEAANIKLPNLEDYAYQILSKIGEVKINGKALGGKVILNVSQLKPGVYYVVIDSGIKPETHELIIN